MTMSKSSCMLFAILCTAAACENGIVSSSVGGASISIVVAPESGGPLAAPVDVDSIVVLVSGPQTARERWVPGQGETVTIGNLLPGAYTVRLEAWVGATLAWLSEAPANVSAGATAELNLVAVTTTSVPTGARNVPYGLSLEAAGGDGSYAWSLAAGSGGLPPGLSLGSNGSISGSVDDIGTWPFTVEVVSGVYTATRAMNVTIVAPPVLGPGDSCAASPGYAIGTFEAGSLETAVREALGVDETALLTCDLLATLSMFVFGVTEPSLLGIQNLTGLVILELSGACSPTPCELPSLAGLSTLTTLTLHGAELTDLTPLSGLPELIHLDIAFNEVSDLSPLSGLTNLANLILIDNDISDLGALSGLTGLAYLLLGDNQISDLSPLSGLTSLSVLGVGSNQVVDVSPLSGLTNLAYLDVVANSVSDVSPLAGLANLELLALSDNAVSSIGPLSSLMSLVELRAEGNMIADLSPLSALNNLGLVYLDRNAIVDLSPLAGLDGLTVLTAGGNQITDIGPIAGLTSLTMLSLWENTITDISAVAGLSELSSLHLHNNAGLSNVQPLVDNAAFGIGDNLDVRATSVSCADVATLAARGVTVSSDCP